VHDLPAESNLHVVGESNYVLFQVLTPAGVLEPDKAGNCEGLTEIVAASSCAPGLAERTWVAADRFPRGRWASRTPNTQRISPALRAAELSERADGLGRTRGLPDVSAPMTSTGTEHSPGRPCRRVPHCVGTSHRNQPTVARNIRRQVLGMRHEPNGEHDASQNHRVRTSRPCVAGEVADEKSRRFGR